MIHMRAVENYPLENLDIHTELGCPIHTPHDGTVPVVTMVTYYSARESECVVAVQDADSFVIYLTTGLENSWL